MNVIQSWQFQHLAIKDILITNSDNIKNFVMVRFEFCGCLEFSIALVWFMHPWLFLPPSCFRVWLSIVTVCLPSCLPRPYVLVLVCYSQFYFDSLSSVCCVQFSFPLSRQLDSVLFPAVSSLPSYLMCVFNSSVSLVVVSSLAVLLSLKICGCGFSYIFFIL